jgi:hypothetical protein
MAGIFVLFPARSRARQASVRSRLLGGLHRQHQRPQGHAREIRKYVQAANKAKMATDGMAKTLVAFPLREAEK